MLSCLSVFVHGRNSPADRGGRPWTLPWDPVHLHQRLQLAFDADPIRAPLQEPQLHVSCRHLPGLGSKAAQEMGSRPGLGQQPHACSMLLDSSMCRQPGLGKNVDLKQGKQVEKAAGTNPRGRARWEPKSLRQRELHWHSFCRQVYCVWSIQFSVTPPATPPTAAAAPIPPIGSLAGAALARAGTTRAEPDCTAPTCRPEEQLSANNLI